MYFLTIITKPLEIYETKNKTKVTPCKGWLFFNPFQTYNELATQGDSLKLSDNCRKFKPPKDICSPRAVCCRLGW